VKEALPSAHDILHRLNVFLLDPPKSSGLRHCLTLYTALTPMARLNDAITALDLLGSVVQAVPVVGENLKSATEIAKKLCEMVKVCICFSGPRMRLTCHAEDQGESRGV
jgi:hypothetical protein